MYLTEEQVVVLLSCLAELAGVGSRLSVNFGVGGKGKGPADKPTAKRSTAAALAGEPFRFQGSPGDARPFLAALGWTASDVLTGPELAARYLTSNVLPRDHLNPLAFAVSATKA